MAHPLAGIIVPLGWAVFIGALALSALLGAILAYHWFRYAMNPGVAFTATVAYAAVTGFLLMVILGAAIAIQIAY